MVFLPAGSACLLTTADRLLAAIRVILDKDILAARGFKSRRKHAKKSAKICTDSSLVFENGQWRMFSTATADRQKRVRGENKMESGAQFYRLIAFYDLKNLPRNMLLSKLTRTRHIKDRNLPWWCYLFNFPRPISFSPWAPSEPIRVIQWKYATLATQPTEGLNCSTRYISSYPLKNRKK